MGVASGRQGQSYGTVTIALKNYSPLLYSSTLQTFLARVQGFSLMVTTHSSTALKTEDIFIYTSFWVKKVFVSGHQTQERAMFIPTISLSIFSLLLTCINPTMLMDAKQWALTLF